MEVKFDKGPYFEQRMKDCLQYILERSREEQLDNDDSDLCKGLNRGTDQRV